MGDRPWIRRGILHEHGRGHPAQHQIGSQIVHALARTPIVRTDGRYRRGVRDGDRTSASTTMPAAPEAVFAVLADPTSHAHIDGTGWVRAAVQGDRITAVGQVFRMGMFHEGHPDKDYEIANLVEVFPPFPLFPPDHLANSLQHLAELVGDGRPA